MKEILKHIDDSGKEMEYERYSTDLSVTDFDHDPKNKDACNECPIRARNLSCPPYSPTFNEYTAGSSHAQVICIRAPMEHFADLPVEDRYHVCFRKAVDILPSGALVVETKKGRQEVLSGDCIHLR